MQKPIKNFEKYVKTENNCLLKNRGYLRFMYSDIRNFQRELQKKTEDAEELKARKISILKRAGLPDEADNTELNQRIASLEKLIQKLDNQHQKFSHLLEETQKKYADLQEQAAHVNDAELDEARRNAKKEHTDYAIKRIRNTFGEKFSVVRMMEARKNVERMTEKNKCFHEKDKFQKYTK